ncbi:Flagellar M-ring protein FliF [hydrothermal vent metagenome]|uniref:Flagellar M-ring protein FliF n=1 Tax=hydrothermal vent metagenome TaxID=652676 RepID=A0A3B1AJN8_9ZZZZ
MDLVKVDNVNKPFVAMTALPIIRQVGLLVGLAASIAIGIYAVLWSQEAGFVPLASNLPARETSKIISILQTAALEYKIDQASGNVLVKASELQNAKLKMAAEGISASADVGYELLEEEQGISTSQFMENVRYQRAVQGELSRTISSMTYIKSARVHLAIPKQTPFIRSKRKSSASVFLDLYSGRQLNDEQVSSIVSLVAMSIPNLRIENVAVIDNKGRLLSSNKKESGVELSNTQLKYTRKIENDFASRIDNILLPIVGYGKMKAQVVANIDFDQIEKTREEFDSEQPSIRSERKVEEQSTGNSLPIGIPGALSNQPPGTANKNTKTLSNRTSGPPSRNSKQSTLNYELNKTISHTRYSAAKIRRLTVAVVVDNKLELIEQAAVKPVTKPAEGAEPVVAAAIKKVLTSVPRTEAELVSFTTLVKDAIGFNAIRGDRVNVINVPFVKPEKIEAIPDIPIWKQDWVLDIAKQALGIIFVLYLVFGILRPVMRKLATHQEVIIPDEEQNEAQIDEDQVTLSEEAEQQKKLLDKHEDNLTIAKSMVAQDPKLVAQVVKNWVSNE